MAQEKIKAAAVVCLMAGGLTMLTCLASLGSASSAVETQTPARANRLQKQADRERRPSPLSEGVAALMERHQTDPLRRYDVKAFELLERTRAEELQRTFGASLKPLGLRDIQTKLLMPGTLLLEYSLGERQSWLWIVGQSSLRTYALPPRAEIESSVQAVRDLLAQGYSLGKSAPLDLMLSKLSEMLLPDAVQQLDSQKLIIVPDDVLLSVPFAALTTPRNPTGPPEFVVAHHEVVTVSSAATLSFLRLREEKRPQAPNLLAVLADPVFSAADPRAEKAGAEVDSRFAGLSRLPYTASEAQAILSLASGREQFSAFLGFAANRQAVLDGRLRNYRYIHFATHGILDADRSGNSGLLLSALDANGQRQDALLTGSDIRRLHLESDLVVLSACQTGLPAETSADETVPLVRNFLQAGASRVLVSYWNVSDRATSDLMARFYTHLLKEKLSPEAALRAAQDSMRKDPRWSSPYYWAGFGLYG